MVILQKNNGQFGNKLLISAHVMAYCLSQGEPLLSFTFPDETTYFNLSTFRKYHIYVFRNRWARPVVHVLITLAQKVTDILLNYRLVERHSIGWIHREIRDIQPRQAPIFVLEGEGFRSTVDLQAQAVYIRELFTPKRQYIHTIERILAPLKKDKEVLIGVHLRRGDYRQWQGGKYYYDDQTYRNIIHQMRQLFTRQTIQFVLCSDEPIDTHYFSDDDLYISTQKTIIDLYLLARCNYLVGPPSTFSGWASFFGNVPLCTIENKDIAISLSAFTVSTL